MEISFSPSDDYAAHGRERRQGADLAAVSRADLRWHYFLGRLSISHSGTEIGPPWGWVPLFDAMYCVQQVVVFAQGGEALGRIDFTENDESIGFELERNGSLRVVPTYRESELRCSVAEFVAAGAEFIRRELGRVMAEYPALAGNEHACALAEEVGPGAEA
ncbi:hypothetical protein ABZ532_06120 [Streptomyces sp. NPDC019396]|uniref:hypothetical protein n=1 Tax=Streptomyces sp. NPDC019396 TaxID=3154687 RepID=UPI0033D772A1